jgi:hypothetical protein
LNSQVHPANRNQLSRASGRAAFILALLFLTAPVLPAGGTTEKSPDLLSPASVLPLPVSITDFEGRTTLLDLDRGSGGGQPGIEPQIDVRPEILRLFGRLLAMRLAELGLGPPEKYFPVEITFTIETELSPPGMPAAPRNFDEQGYVLEVSAKGILCRAGTELGLVNGFSTLLQLLHSSGRKVTVPNCRIADWPEFSTRYVTEYHIPGSGFLDWMARYKINGFATSYRAFKWDNPGEQTIQAMTALGTYIDEHSTISHMVQIHIGGRGGGVLDIGDEDQITTLLETISFAVEKGKASHIMICHDDAAPVLKGREIGIFETAAHAHIYLLGRIEEYLHAGYPDVGLSFCTPYYRGFQHKSWRNATRAAAGYEYMAVISAWHPSKTAIVWTGPNTESFRIVAADIWSYRKLVGEEKELLYWDNTWHINQPLRSFRARYPRGFADDCYDDIALVNIFATRPIGRFFSATAMDYYWNAEQFDPVRSRQAAVSRFMGPGAVSIAEEFYGYRGSSYYSSFVKRADIERLRDIFSRMRDASVNKELAGYCLEEIDNMEMASK